MGVVLQIVVGVASNFASIDHCRGRWKVDPHLIVHIPPVQQQKGSSDCGAYAIAFAVHAALGDDAGRTSMFNMKT